VTLSDSVWQARQEANRKVTSDIKTTQQYYLSVRPEDVTKAQVVQASLLDPVAAAGATDQKMAKSAVVRRSAGQRLQKGLAQALKNKGLGKRTLQNSNLTL